MSWSVLNSSTVTLWVAFSVADTATAIGGSSRYCVIPAGYSLEQISTSRKIYFKLASSGSVHLVATKF
jgi:hypothetical protein